MTLVDLHIFGTAFLNEQKSLYFQKVWKKLGWGGGVGGGGQIFPIKSDEFVTSDTSLLKNLQEELSFI